MNIKKNFKYFETKTCFCVCSVIAKMFEQWNSCKNQKKKITKILEYWPKVIYGFDLGHKNFKTVSCLCTFQQIHNFPTGLHSTGVNCKVKLS